MWRTPRCGNRAGDDPAGRWNGRFARRMERPPDAAVHSFLFYRKKTYTNTVNTCMMNEMFQWVLDVKNNSKLVFGITQNVKGGCHG